jgi:anti-sigma factor RsiW
MSSPLPQNCDDFEDDKTAFILAVLDPERVDALEQHLLQCERCRIEVALGSSDIDALMLLAPEMEPPQGFEDRVFSAMQSETHGVSESRPDELMLLRTGQVLSDSLGFRSARKAQKPRRLVRGKPVALLVCFVAIAAGSYVFGGGGIEVGRSAVPSTSVAVPSARSGRVAPLSFDLSSARSLVGSVTIYQGKTSWMVVSLVGGPKTGFVGCRLVEANGKPVDLGRFRSGGPRTSWGTSLPLKWDHARRIEIVSASGKVIATTSKL